MQNDYECFSQYAQNLKPDTFNKTRNAVLISSYNLPITN